MNIRDGEGVTPLGCAVAVQDLATVRLLLDHRADPSLADAVGLTPLAYAACLAAPEVVRILLACGADPALHRKEALSALARANDRLRREQEIATLLRGASLERIEARPPASAAH